MEKSKKPIKAIVKAVFSGDFVSLYKSSKTGPGTEY